MKDRSHRRLFQLATLGWFWASTQPAVDAQCSRLSSPHTHLSGAIGLVSDGSLSPEVIADAVDLWKQCGGYGVEFPFFQTGGDGASRTLHVRYERIREHPGGRKRCGWFSGNTIVLFGYVRSTSGRLHHCGTPARNLAHELGHVLGLADSPPVLACANHIMSDLDPTNLYSRNVRSDECRTIGKRWITPLEDPRAAQGRKRADRTRDHASHDALRRSSRGAPPPHQ